MLASSASPHARIQIPAELPQEYELAIGFVREGTQSVFLIDAGGSRSGLSGRSANIHSGEVLPKENTVRIVFFVRRAGLAVEAIKQQIFFQKTDRSGDCPDSWGAVPRSTSAGAGGLTLASAVLGELGHPHGLVD